jgi:hypothetical protein
MEGDGTAHVAVNMPPLMFMHAVFNPLFGVLLRSLASLQAGWSGPAR